MQGVFDVRAVDDILLAHFGGDIDGILVVDKKIYTRKACCTGEQILFGFEYTFKFCNIVGGISEGKGEVHFGGGSKVCKVHPCSCFLFRSKTRAISVHMHTLRRQRGEFAEELLSCVGAIFGCVWFSSGLACGGGERNLRWRGQRQQLSFLHLLEANVGCAGGHASRLERI